MGVAFLWAYMGDQASQVLLVEQRHDLDSTPQAQQS